VTGSRSGVQSFESDDSRGSAASTTTGARPVAVALARATGSSGSRWTSCSASRHSSRRSTHARARARSRGPSTSSRTRSSSRRNPLSDDVLAAGSRWPPTTQAGPARAVPGRAAAAGCGFYETSNVSRAGRRGAAQLVYWLRATTSRSAPRARLWRGERWGNRFATASGPSGRGGRGAGGEPRALHQRLRRRRDRLLGLRLGRGSIAMRTRQRIGTRRGPLRRRVRRRGAEGRLERTPGGWACRRGTGSWRTTRSPARREGANG